MKYKLIKTYPGSPKLGTIVDHHYSNDKYGFCISYTEKSDNWKEFWEEVVEKDYKILSLARFCSIKPSITDVSDYGDGYIEALLKCDKARIHSVKRLSDGEIFAIGDIIKCEDCKGKIISLEIYDNDIYLTGIDNKMPFGYTLCNALDCFEIPQKAKQKLFTTEDGVDIFEGDIVWHINLKTNKEPYTSIVKYTKPFTPVKGLFSTKEKAEEYILLNKPCLSINEITNLTETNPSDWLNKKLIKLVKSKI